MKVPRPPNARMGGPAPWAALDRRQRSGLTIDRVVEALGRAGQSGRPPTMEAWSAEPASVVLDTTELRAGAVPAAVLVALFEEAGEARVVLTRRSAALRNHTGQVSFPGGRMDPGEQPWGTARREAFEEVALDPGSIEPLGWLHSVLTLGSGSLILPVVGTLGGRPTLTPSQHEVARVFDVALADLLADDVYTEERWPAPRSLLPGVPDDQIPPDHPVVFFQVAGELVWGATARMLAELLRLVVGDEAGVAEVPTAGGILVDRRRVGSAMIGDVEHPEEHGG